MSTGHGPRDAVDFDHPPADPLPLLERWLEDAKALATPNPTAMTLATVDADGAPSARIVLLRGLTREGARFFTNRNSRKGKALGAHARAALLFHWDLLDRQVRIEGSVTRVPDAESDAYFASRPRQAQLASAASPQSRVLQGRGELEQLVRDLEQKVGDGNVPRPSHWGGYVIAPESIEFWQGRDARLHDRLRFVRDRDAWRIERIAP